MIEESDYRLGLIIHLPPTFSFFVIVLYQEQLIDSVDLQNICHFAEYHLTEDHGNEMVIHRKYLTIPTFFLTNVQTKSTNV